MKTVYVPLRKFWTLGELMPVLEHGGIVTVYDLLIQAACTYNGEQPWEIHLRGWKSVADQKEDLLHELIHIHHASKIGYVSDPQENRLFHEKETERHTQRLMKRSPTLVDEIVDAIKKHPKCILKRKTAHQALSEQRERQILEAQ